MPHAVSFHLQQCPSKGLQGLYLTFNSSHVSGAQQRLLVGLEVKETFGWNIPEAGERSVQFPCRILRKIRFCVILYYSIDQLALFVNSIYISAGK